MMMKTTTIRKPYAGKSHGDQRSIVDLLSTLPLQKYVKKGGGWVCADIVSSLIFF